MLIGYEGDKDAYCRQYECLVADGFTGDKEAYCEAQCPGESCEVVADQRLASLGAGSSEAAMEPGAVNIASEHYRYAYCPIDTCGYPIPFHQKECVRYTDLPYECNVKYFNASDPAYATLDPSELYGCPEECKTLLPMKNCQTQNSEWDENAEKWVAKCPSQCMWITTNRVTDDTCLDDCESLYPSDPQYLWDNNLSDQTCVYIIPDIVFERPDDCSGCIFVAEKGLTMKPQVIMDCTALCGASSQVIMAEDPATMTNNIKGMVGPTELVSVSKLMVPAYVLPFFCLAVTLMFIMTLSPMLGGDIDIPGMMRMIQ